jgi:hypothetical protein
MVSIVAAAGPQVKRWELTLLLFYSKIIYMFEVLLTSLRQWSATKNERQKLQHSYLLLTVVIVFAAGVVTLFNMQLGHGIAKIALVVAGAYAVNAIVWNLLQSSLFDKLQNKPKRK